MRKLELMHEVAQTFAMVDHARQMIAKKSCRYGQHKSFQRLLSLLLLLLLLWLLC